MKIISTILFLIWGVFMSLGAVGQHSPDAHTHGKSHMTLVFENRHLVVEMTTPAANMLGFEHHPHSDKQWHTLDILKQKLQQPNDLIVLDPECESKSSTVELPFIRAAQGKLHAANSREVHQHLDHQKDQHQNGRGRENNGHADHSDIHSRYEWLCERSVLPKLTFGYFIEYPNFETIRVEWIINGKQGMNQLNKRESTLEIAQ